MQDDGLGLRDVPAARGDHRRPQPLVAEHHRIVEIHELGAVIQLEAGQRQRQPAAAQQRRQEPLAAEPGELFDDRRERSDRQVEAAEVVGIVVAALALVDAGKPERAVRTRLAGAFIPREAAVKDHAEAAGVTRTCRTVRRESPASVLRRARGGWNRRAADRRAAG